MRFQRPLQKGGQSLKTFGSPPKKKHLEIQERKIQVYTVPVENLNCFFFWIYFVFFREAPTFLNLLKIPIKRVFCIRDEVNYTGDVGEMAF